MGTRIYVGNVPYEASVERLQGLFEEQGWVVRDVHIPTDRATGRSRGFAFVELGDEEQVRAAIERLDGSDMDGRRLQVKEARERAPRPPRRRPGGFEGEPLVEVRADGGRGRGRRDGGGRRRRRGSEDGFNSDW